MERAVFLDRDGVINKLALNSKTGEFESPHSPSEFELFPWVIDSLKLLIYNGYILFTVSNQPSFAKGKVSMEKVKAVHDKFHGLMVQNSIPFREYYYCYHHPKGIIKEYSYECDCRKPKPYFINSAIKLYNIDRSETWMIGDRDTDILCGIAAGVKTVLIKEPLSSEHHGRSEPDITAQNLKEAADKLIEYSIKG